MDAAEDLLAFMTFPREHRAQTHSTNPLGRFNKEIKRRTDVIGISPPEDPIIRLVAVCETSAEFTESDLVLASSISPHFAFFV